MNIKIHGGTPAHGCRSLCDSCRHGRIIRGRTLDEEIVLCDASHMVTTRIAFKVTSCSDYDDRSLPTYWDLMQQAWILQPGTRRRPAGFVRASDLRAEELERSMRELHKRHEP